MSLGGVLVNMRRDVLVVDLLLRNTLLIHTHTSQQRSGPRIDLGATIADDTDDDFFPRILAPRLAVGTVAHVLDVLKDAHHCASEQHVVLVVHCDDDEELCVAGLAEQALAQGEVFVVEVAWIAGCRRVAHVCELVALAVGVLLEEDRGDGTVEDQISAVEQNLLDCLPAL